MTTELTQLTGTDKQIEFANDLRETFLTCWVGEEDKIDQYGDKGERGVGAAIVAANGEEAQTVIDSLIAETSAKVWIEMMYCQGVGKLVKTANMFDNKKRNCVSILCRYKQMLADK